MKAVLAGINFANEQVKKWDEFIEQIKKLSKSSGKWVYRGHTEDYELATTLERVREYFDIKWSDLPGIEEQLIWVNGAWVNGGHIPYFLIS
ncbi:MAG: hypothetical protein Q8N09_05145 [Thermodesulfovibrionia bacterium]|nr:hypothetical protein [Thermodesulfovibrionia bacterium]